MYCPVRTRTHTKRGTDVVMCHVRQFFELSGNNGFVNSVQIQHMCS